MKEHDKTAFRLSSILIKLNEGDHPSIDELAKEYNVHKRTIQRDINERLSYLPIQKDNGRISLDPAYLGKLSTDEIRNFAALSGVKSLFPTLDNTFLRRIFDDAVRSAYLVKGHHYENLSGKDEIFKRIEEAIIHHKKLTFWYKSTQRTVEPYRLINQKGIWYLAAVEDKLKSFSIAKIFEPLITGEVFVPDASISELIEKSETQWIGIETKEAVFQIDSEASPYFRRRNLIPDQTIEKELEDGGLIVSGRFTDETQALNIVGYWLPHIKILSPIDLHDTFRMQLKKYIEQEY
ncbi:helix-turn-helix, type 11 domain-containing protein [Sulfuricurvum kujiense DSM 16994]|uniref:Helix-turn-helix, type 11 domain-containing protein n=1 Tax=Sulfuricurvum kujiense (strain ATCC BAA-921 / DSM 16994 / JCM 11577 / YK-1) TaxID=709032 RepID=E4TYD5_SULKY|nr:WYL domain-containing transcriptional regulator [Sulfuricurvum kujiense]ADR35080.1 helix-turn-helix, type 11 domain-containing protein [Sulfuricurvum kujiense DSM 16994]